MPLRQDPARALPVLRQRRCDPRQGLPHAVPALLPRVRHRAHRRDAVLQHARSARGRGLVRAGRRDPAHARSRDVRGPALRAARRPAALRHDDARGDAVGRLSAELPQTDDRARGHAGLRVPGGLRERVHAGPEGERAVRSPRSQPVLLALTAPTVNSYRRLQPRFWSSAYTAWGPDNREGAIRVPSQRRGIEMESTNLELKPSDPSSNPYLSLGALLAAGLDGIQNKRDPGEPTLVDPDTLSDDERRRRGIRRRPTSLGEALDALERDDVLRAALGETLAKEYLTVKRSEVRGFDGKDVAFEIEQHFYKF